MTWSPTPTQRRNVAKLARHLESLPDDYEHFDMATYLAHQGDCDLFPEPPDDSDASPVEIAYAASPAETLANCGTVACALGHGPAAGVPLGRCYRVGEGARWEDYSWKKFGVPFTSVEWDFAFGPGWRYVDNTPRGAAARLRWLLAGELLPNEPYSSGDLHRVVRRYSKYRKVPVDA